MNREKTTATLLVILFMAGMLSVIPALGDGSTLSPPTPEMQGMVLELTSEDGPIRIEAFTWYRETLDGDAGWHFRLIVKKVEGSIARADVGDELYAVWTYIEGVGPGFIVNSKGFNLHLKATDPRVGSYPYGDFYGHTSRYYKQLVVGRTYGKVVTGTLKQINWEPAVPGEHPTYPP